MTKDEILLSLNSRMRNFEIGMNGMEEFEIRFWCREAGEEHCYEWNGENFVESND